MALVVKDANGVNQLLPSFVDAAYSWSVYNQAAVTSATDVIQLAGAGGIVGRLKRLSMMITPGIATAASQQVALFRRSAAATGGTQTAQTTQIAKHNIGSAANSCVLTLITVSAATAGTAAGTVRAGSLFAATATGAAVPLVWEFGVRQDMAPMLVGASDFLTVGFAGVTPGAGWSCELQWEEGAQ